MERLNLPDQALNVGRFVVDRLVGGAWAALADQIYSDETHARSMEHLANITLGEE